MIGGLKGDAYPFQGPPDRLEKTGVKVQRDPHTSRGGHPLAILPTEIGPHVEVRRLSVKDTLSDEMYAFPLGEYALGQFYVWDGRGELSHGV